MNTEQAPHTPCSHPRCVPVRLNSSRRKSARVSRGGTDRRTSLPFTVAEMATARGASAAVIGLLLSHRHAPVRGGQRLGERGRTQSAGVVVVVADGLGLRGPGLG